MNAFRFLPIAVLVVLLCAPSPASEGSPQAVNEKSFQAPNNVTVKVRMQAPYDMDTPLQVICYFKHKKSGDKTLGAAVELDEKLGGVIALLRNQGEFVGDELETLVLTPPEGTIKPKRLLLVGLGDEDNFSLETLERVGRVSFRMAANLGVERVAFAPLLRDQGNSKFGTGDVERAVTRGMLLAYDSDKRLQDKNMAKTFTLQDWVAEAGQQYFTDTVSGAQKGIEDAATKIDCSEFSPRCQPEVEGRRSSATPLSFVNTLPQRRHLRNQQQSAHFLREGLVLDPDGEDGR